MKVLITGGASGIGKSIVKYLMNKHDVTVMDINSLKYKSIKYIPINLASSTDIETYFAEKNKSYDVLINAAGVREIIPPHELDTSEWERIQRINVTAPFVLSKHVIRQALLDNRKVSIINLASVSGLLAEPNRAAYVASKHAIIGLTKQLAYQYGKYGIRVNAIAPGIIETPLTADYFTDPKTMELIQNNTPVATWGQPEHLHALVDICLSNEYITGSILVCDGGWSCGKSL